MFMFYAAEVPQREWERWPANRLGRYRHLGQLDVNFDYYPSWNASDRLVMMPFEEARDAGLVAIVQGRARD